MRVLVTGSEGFIGRNLRVALRRRPGLEVVGFDLGQTPDELDRLAAEAEFVFHLAGVNRPRDPAEYEEGNVHLTARLLDRLAAAGRKAPFVFSSSTQAALDNPYGTSKRRAEELARAYAESTGAPVRIFRFPNVFGKWSRPNYNSVVSTFCHNAAHGLALVVSDPGRTVTFVHVDEVVRCLVECLDQPLEGFAFGEVGATDTVTLGELHDLVEGFRQMRMRNEVPDLGRPFVRRLYSTFLSYLEPADRVRPTDLKRDARGWLFELIKSAPLGQVFVSSTRPGVVRGGHYHDSKVEKFCVIRGHGRIRMRRLLSDEIVEYDVSDDPICVVDIPPGWTHTIENVGSEDMITLFWAGEVFDPNRPDTWAEQVDPPARPVGEGAG